MKLHSKVFAKASFLSPDVLNVHIFRWVTLSKATFESSCSYTTGTYLSLDFLYCFSRYSRRKLHDESFYRDAIELVMFASYSLFFYCDVSLFRKLLVYFLHVRP
jgi:hypothetical protein